MAILSEVKTLIANQLGVDIVSEDQRIVEDLGAESSDILNIIAAVEDKYGIKVTDDALQGLQTVRDVYLAIDKYTK